MHKSKIKQISLAVCLALMPLSNYAAGLGKLNVNSGIGEPLRAEIELLSVTPDELSTLAATIASEDAYAQQGIPRLGIHNNIKVDIAKNADGSPVLKIHSNQPVSDPYLDMLIQVDWATGRLQREYTVLLDPPGYKPEPASVAPVSLPSVGDSNVTNSSNNNVQSTADSSSAGEVVEPATKKTKKNKKPVAVKEEPAQVEVDSTGQELTTKRGDTLSAIAREMQVEGVSLDQMLVGLYENNKEAFDKGNMNRLKVGQIIKVPSKDALTSVGQPEAKKTIKIHSANWNAYRNALAGNVEAAPAKVEAEQKQSSTGKIATAVDKAAPVASGPKDVVKLSAGDKAAKDSAKSAEAKIAALQEETTARENSVKEANDRAAALEKQIADMQKLIAMKSQSMADMQKNAEAASKKPEATDKPKEVAKVEVTPPVEVKPTEVKPAEVMPPAEVKVAEPMPAAEVKPAEVMVEAKPKVKKPVVVPPPVVEEPGFLSGLLSSFDLTDLTVLGGAGGAALLGGGWMYLRNKRRKDLDSFERGILTSGGLRANTVFGNTTGNASMSDTSFLTDFAQSADGSMIDTNDVDPIAEAEVYMAYGRDAQAEEILKDAITKEPKRYELHLKLLELYAARKDNSAFEAIAGELYTTLGSSDPTWAKVVVMGAELEPGNPLYKSTSVSSVDTLSTQKLDAEDFSDMAVAESSDLDFSLDDDSVGAELANEDAASNAVMQSFAGAKDVESEISFDLGSLDENANEQGADISNEVAITPVTAESASENLMDFDLSSFSEPVETALQETVNEISLPDIADEALVLNGPTISNVAETSLSSATDFDMDFNLPDTSEIASKVASNAVAPSVMEDISFDIDLPNEEQLAPALTQMAADASEISFDLSVIEEPVVASVESAVQSTSLEANAFDLSAIDLNLGDTESELKSDSPAKAVSAELDMVESEDVNIKLDLVAAYIDMDDKEGARELLEEILKEGGSQQQARAKELLDSLA